MVLSPSCIASQLWSLYFLGDGCVLGCNMFVVSKARYDHLNLGTTQLEKKMDSSSSTVCLWHIPRFRITSFLPNVRNVASRSLDLFLSVARDKTNKSAEMIRLAVLGKIWCFPTFWKSQRWLVINAARCEFPYVVGKWLIIVRTDLRENSRQHIHRAFYENIFDGISSWKYFSNHKARIMGWWYHVYCSKPSLEEVQNYLYGGGNGRRKSIGKNIHLEYSS